MEVFWGQECTLPAFILIMDQNKIHFTVQLAGIGKVLSYTLVLTKGEMGPATQ